LLYGPPGTGKTLLAKAVAKESGANMIEISGASINNMYYGESEKNVRAIFKLAKKKEPMVIFIDEADAMLGSRGRPNEGGARRDIVNQFLREWDGMDKMKAFIMVATNRPFDLDDAVLRRLPRKILVDLPLEVDRVAIFKIHLKGEMLDDSVSMEKLAKQTPLYSGSDIKNVCVAAAMAAVKEEIEASEKHAGLEPYVWPEKRILNVRHFDKALAEIPASVSEDMSSLNAIKRFDERYGDRKLRRKKRGMGFDVVPEAIDSHGARVRAGI
jgi:SpoVK/Ycf46/Vps4 family AAA+-type ATPase